VSSLPSPQLLLKEFHEWYEEEHIPLRLNRFREFLSGARYKLISRQGHREDGHPCGTTQTSWLALYEVASPALFSSSAYQDLRTNRSERECDVMSRIEVLTRITGEIIGTSRSQEERTTGFKPGQPSGWVITNGINTRGVNGDKKVSFWASQLEQEVAKYSDIEEGWVRTLLVLVLESGVSNFGIGAEADDRDEVRMPYFAVHEFKDRGSAESFSELILGNTDVGIEVGERTIWELYKAYACVAHNND